MQRNAEKFREIQRNEGKRRESHRQAGSAGYVIDQDKH